MAYFEAQARDLADLAERSRARRLTKRAGRDFSSNDYLALASDPELAVAVRGAIDAGVPIGSGGSRLLRGNHDAHERLEAEAATFFGAESALYFSTGYAANAALLATLPQRGDLVVHDALVHASAHEGTRLSRAEVRSAGHNDVGDFEDAILDWRHEGGVGRVWIAVESLYSMDGDRAPLDALAALADRHEAILLVDEAHATGVFGDSGRGLAAGLAGRENLITLHTCGKALGCEGALLCGPQVVRDFLVNRGRAFIFSTAPSPLMAEAVRVALRLIAEPERRARLHALIARAEALLAPVDVQATGSQILPLVLGEDARTMAAAAALQERGFDVRGIRPPTVPAGTSRLRISVTLNVREDDVAALADALGSLACG
ncbi:8-amino-7-oxononanoate synthase [Sphingomonas sp. R-74633]|uniref:8-amino-7-oxononanoate synthase n=1 Tax=Sphingomonas sp. R-74633 TaxID=2751188 RepID=UPI0015D22FC1|nr:8-amino-7-oxononanoate synthase [Sphingomonas sp. R-74633]NYT40921.1 8-amino-7-oxononanoate synthase [Sphingomonas sp. R-74633]